jgi:uncharacterized protein YraI
MPQVMKRRTSTAFGALVLGVGAALALTPAAGAEPATPVVYPAGSSATLVIAPGFDTCTAPSLAALAAWQASPFDTVNIYFGGANRGCVQPNLTADWVTDASAGGWHLLPTYMGFQPSCTFSSKIHRYNQSTATSVGDSNARDAVNKATAIGLRHGSTLYADVEHYNRNDSSCVTAVRRYVSAWTKTLHANGYLAGVYVHQDSGLPDLSAVYSSTAYARPDAVWMARWDGNPSISGWPTAPNWQWSFHQRAKQYRGDHTETWGGVSLNIDSDNIDAPVATVAYWYGVLPGPSVTARTGPANSYPAVRTYPAGSSLATLCQTTGQQVGTTAVWNRLVSGTWVSDFYIDTPSSTGFSAPLPRCTYPGQVTSATPLTARTGPGTSFAASGALLQPGALAWVMCQKAGSLVGTTGVWNRMSDGRWVTDYYVSNRSNTTWSAPVPRCP